MILTPMVIAETACTQPDHDATVTKPVAPYFPPSASGGARHIVVRVLVTVAPDGSVTKTEIVQSSGDATLDRSVVGAAKKSTYSPKVASCQAVTGTYVYEATFQQLR